MYMYNYGLKLLFETSLEKEEHLIKQD